VQIQQQLQSKEASELRAAAETVVGDLKDGKLDDPKGLFRFVRALTACCAKTNVVEPIALQKVEAVIAVAEKVADSDYLKKGIEKAVEAAEAAVAAGAEVQKVVEAAAAEALKPLEKELAVVEAVSVEEAIAKVLESVKESSNQESLPALPPSPPPPEERSTPPPSTTSEEPSREASPEDPPAPAPSPAAAETTA
jgi:hypothetical protein